MNESVPPDKRSKYVHFFQTIILINLNDVSMNVCMHMFVCVNNATKENEI